MITLMTIKVPAVKWNISNHKNSKSNKNNIQNLNDEMTKMKEALDGVFSSFAWGNAY